MIEPLEPIHILVTPYLADLLPFLFDQRYLNARFDGVATVHEKSVGKIKRELIASPQDTIAVVNVSSGIFDDLVSDERFLFEPVLRMDVLLKCSPDFADKHEGCMTDGRPHDRKTIQKFPLALYSEPALSMVIDEILDNGKIDIVIHTTNPEQVRQVVARGEAATFCDSFTRAAKPDFIDKGGQSVEFLYLPIEGRPGFTAGFLSCANANKTSGCRRFEEICRHYLKTEFDTYLKEYPLA